jgi:predicted nucleotidyltransferase
MKATAIKQAVEQAVKASPSRSKILRIRLFGSQLHGDAKPDSDVDLLIDVREPCSVGLFELVRIERELREALGRDVDLVTSRGLSRYMRDEVLAEAETVYE